MKTPEDAERAGGGCLRLARGWGRPADVAVTDMSQPLGDAVGNALDIVEAVELLRATFRGRLRDLAVLFAARALEAAEHGSHDEAVARAEQALDGGDALERFRPMVEAQGGDPRVVDDPHAILPEAPVVLPILSERAVPSPPWRPRRSARRASRSGRGPDPQGRRHRPRPSGWWSAARSGTGSSTGEPIGEVHARSEEDAEEAAILRVLGGDVHSSRAA